MGDTQGGHPSAERLGLFAAGRLGAAEHTEVAGHVADCPRCWERLDLLGDPLLHRLRHAARGRMKDEG